ncbi:uncharacterized protein LOC124703310 [Lolium rigidum]|uniref:uncharacterized protein LOC124703310 n=1 Tax=Lolium rigidum TaxID=89674 RepID=UPI001F5DCBA4|nr:uncharacterized protein LOC124703310 [Lolium rigidum]
MRRSVVACRMEQETNRFGGGGGWGKTMRMRSPRPVWGRWRSGTPVDRFDGFLDLPVEFEVEMPPRVLSARLEAPKQEEVVIQKVNPQVATKKQVFLHLRLQAFLHLRLQAFLHLQLQAFPHLRLRVFVHLQLQLHSGSWRGRCK